MANTKYLSTGFIYGSPLQKPCCLLNGNTADIGEPQAGEVCVDLGSGQGETVVMLARAVGNTGFVYGVDISKEMLRQSQWRAETFGVKNVELIHSIFEDIELGNGLADLVVSNCSITLAQERRRVWNEIHRILKPGGRFIVSDVFSEETVPRMRLNPVKVEIYWCELMTKEEYLSTVEQAGFEYITIIEESIPYPVVYMGKEILLSSFMAAGQRPAIDHGNTWEIQT
jgi:arsenite methyltransferase